MGNQSQSQDLEHEGPPNSTDSRNRWQQAQSQNLGKERPSEGEPDSQRQRSQRAPTQEYPSDTF